MPVPLPFLSTETPLIWLIHQNLPGQPNFRQLLTTMQSYDDRIVTCLEVVTITTAALWLKTLTHDM